MGFEPPPVEAKISEAHALPSELMVEPRRSFSLFVPPARLVGRIAFSWLVCSIALNFRMPLSCSILTAQSRLKSSVVQSEIQWSWLCLLVFAAESCFYCQSNWKVDPDYCSRKQSERAAAFWNRIDWLVQRFARRFELVALLRSALGRFVHPFSQSRP